MRPTSKTLEFRKDGVGKEALIAHKGFPVGTKAKLGPKLVALVWHGLGANGQYLRVNLKFLRVLHTHHQDCNPVRLSLDPCIQIRHDFQGGVIQGGPG